MSQGRRNGQRLSLVDSSESIEVTNQLPPGLSCGSCLHWHETERGRVGIAGGFGVGVDLSQPASGQCREHLHSQIVGSPQGMGWQAYYPPTPADFPACGQHRAREAGVVAA